MLDRGNRRRESDHMRRRTFITALAASSAAPSFATCASSQRLRKKPIKITLLGTGTPAPVVKEVHAGDVIEADGWKVTVGRASHVQPQLECLAFRLDSDEGSVCYSGDGGLSDDFVEFARGCEVLIQMNPHFSGTEPTASYRAAVGSHKDNALIAKRAGVKTLVLTHFLAQIDQPGVRERIVHEIQQEFGGRVIWGEDLMQLTLEGSGLTGIGV